MHTHMSGDHTGLRSGSRACGRREADGPWQYSWFIIVSFSLLCNYLYCLSYDFISCRFLGYRRSLARRVAHAGLQVLHVCRYCGFACLRVLRVCELCGFAGFAGLQVLLNLLVCGSRGFAGFADLRVCRFCGFAGFAGLLVRTCLNKHKQILSFN